MSVFCPHRIMACLVAACLVLAGGCWQEVPRQRHRKHAGHAATSGGRSGAAPASGRVAAPAGPAHRRTRRFRQADRATARARVEVLRRRLRAQRIKQATRQAALPARDRTRRARESERRRALRRNRIRHALADDDPRVREHALADLDADADADASLLAHLATADPDPDVRAAAVEHLADGDAAIVTASLLRALHDANRRVVLTALDALDFAGDESVIGPIQALLSHPDPAVRKHAAATIEMLR